MAMMKYPTWLRGLDIVIGIISIIIGVWMIIDITLAQLALLMLVSIVILLFGFSRIIKGIAVVEMKKTSRIVNVLGGLIASLMAFLVYIFQYMTILIIVMFIAIALISIGISRILFGFVEAEAEGWWRLLQIVVGFLNLLLGTLVWFYPSFGWNIAVVLFVIIFIANGFARIITGISGVHR